MGTRTPDPLGTATGRADTASGASVAECAVTPTRRRRIVGAGWTLIGGPHDGWLVFVGARRVGEVRPAAGGGWTAWRDAGGVGYPCELPPLVRPTLDEAAAAVAQPPAVE